MAESNVKVMPGAQPVQPVIEHLRVRLAEAERGEIRAIATVAVKQSGSVSSGWQATGDIWRLMGAIDWLKHRMLTGVSDE